MSRFGCSLAAWACATAASADVWISSNTTLSDGDRRWEGSNLVVSACTLTVDGSHAFARLALTNGAVLTHSAATLTTAPRLMLTVSGSLFVPAGSRIDVTGRGFLPGRTVDNSTVGASDGDSGGSHGGPGGDRYGTAGAVYGSAFEPLTHGGGAGSASRGGAGGGVVRITAGEINLSGAIVADGAAGYKTGAGGAGGSIWLETGLLRGSGRIGADGGAAGASGTAGGGGGGRIAVTYTDVEAFDLAGGLSSRGGTSPHKSGAGSVYTRRQGAGGTLTFDNGGRPWQRPTPFVLRSTAGAPDTLVIKQVGAYPSDPSAELLVSNLTVGAGGVLRLVLADATPEPGLRIVAVGDVEIAAGASIDASRTGYVAGHTLGDATAGASTGCAGGSHGGLGGAWGGTPGPTFGDAAWPQTRGAGAGPINVGGCGGGRVQLSARSVNLCGSIQANGEAGTISGGGGAGGSVLIDAGALTGTGTVQAQGGAAALYIYSGSYYSGGGGGGRIALHAGADAAFSPASVSVAAGVGRGVARAGTVVRSASVAALTVASTDVRAGPSGSITGLVVRFNTGVNPLSATTARFTVSGPAGPVELASADVRGFSALLVPVEPIDLDGDYVLSVASGLVSVAGARLESSVAVPFTLDRIPPAPPQVSGLSPLPVATTVRASSITLTGTRDDRTSVWISPVEAVSNGSGPWTTTQSLQEGVNDLAVHGRDVAGNASCTNVYRIVSDTQPPAAVGLAPTNGACLAVAPARIEVVVAETGSGLDESQCEVTLERQGWPVPGDGALEASGWVWRPQGSLLDGDYVIRVRLTDQVGNVSPLLQSTFTVDRVPPAAPTVRPVSSPTAVAHQTVSGLKEAGAALRVDGVLRVAAGPETAWSLDLPLHGGRNVFSLTCQDRAGNVSAATAVEIVFDDQTPGAVSGLVLRPEGDGQTVEVDWSTYDEDANGADIAAYVVYVSSSPFTDRTLAAPAVTNAAGMKRTVLRDLPRGATSHLAVAAFDLGGRASPDVASMAVVPVDVQAPGPARSLSASCDEHSIALAWLPPEPVAADLAAYSVSVDGSEAARVLPPATQHVIAGFPSATRASISVRALDGTGNASTAAAVTGCTWLPQVTGLVVEPGHERVTVRWTAVEPAAHVARYAVYLGEVPFETVSGRAPAVTGPLCSAVLSGLPNGRTNHVAVTAVNVAGAERPHVVCVPAVAKADTLGPLLSSLRWNGQPLPAVATGTGVLSVDAADPAGVGTVEFSADGAPLEREPGSGPQYRCSWRVAATRDGSHRIEVRATDALGNASSAQGTLDVRLEPPARPVLLTPSAGSVLGTRSVLVTGRADANSDAVRLVVNGVVAAGLPAVDRAGAFSGDVLLGEGTNAVRAVATNRAGDSGPSDPLTLIVDTALPVPPTGVQAASRELGGVRLTWAAPSGLLPAGYHVYRASGSFTERASAARVTASPCVGTAFSDMPPSEGQHVYRVASVSRSGLEGPLSAEAWGESDATLPEARSIDYASTGPRSGTRFGAGAIDIRLTVSEPLMTVPFLSFNLSGQSPWWVPLVRGTGEVYVGRLTVMSDTPNGTWYANLAARDRAGNGGSAIRAGDRIVVDTTGPAPERVALYPEPPVRNDAAAPTSLVAVAVFAPSDIPAVQPECEVRLQPSAQDWRPVALDPLTAASWSGSIAFDAAAGAQPQTLEMRVTAADDLGNIATTRVDRSHWIVYQGDLPALPPPAQVVGAARPGGRVEMSWGAMDGACDFEVRRRGPGAAEAVVCGRTGGATSFAEAAPEGTNLYAVSTVRCAPADESVGPASAELALVADATPPGSPMGLRLALGGSGLQLSWTPPAALDVVSYNAYRSVDRITATSVANLAPILRAASGCGTLDADPPQRPVFYAVTALDAAGNESEPSEAAYTNLTLVPVTGLSVSREGDGPPSLEWRHAAAEGISGYRVHAVDANGRCLLSGEVLAPAITRFTDVTCGRAGRVYEVSAVDLAAGIEKESAARRVSLPWLDVSATPDALLLRGLMNRLSFSVRNAGPGELTDAVLTATAGGVSSVSPAFSVAEGSTGEVSVVMPGSASLPDVVSVTARVDQVSIGGGERATVIGTHRVPAGNGLLTAELRHGGVIRGGVAGVSFVLTNPGAEDVELITARGNGSRPSDEVRFFLETSDGFVLAAAPLREVLGEQEITLGDGTTVLRVQAGGSACVGETSLNVPSTAEGRVVLRLTVDRLHHGLGSDHPLRVEGFTTTCEAVLTDTPYTAVAREAVPNVSRGGDVRLRGEALRRDTGEPAADCPVAVTVRNGATTHTLSCTSGSNGVWECVFTPPALSSGAFDVWAGHPDERASLGQCSFSVNRIAVTPDAFDVTLPRNYEQRLSVTVTAADTLSLTNARLACRKEDQLPPGLHVEPAAGRFLPAGEAATLGATLWGDNRASATGRVVWSVVSDGESEPWASVPVRYRLTEAAPALTLLPERLLMGVTAGARNTSELRVGNSGQADLEGVTAAVRLPDGGPAPAWIRISPAALGDIQPGAWRDVVLSAEPDGNVVPGWLECQIVLSASNHAQAKMGAAVVVSESGAGDFLFRVSDLYYGQVTGASTNTGVSGATVRVRRAASLDAEQTRVTDRRGEALFRDLQAGTYDYRITADGHDAVSGSVRVDPGVTGSAEVFMPCRVVSVEWRVVPTLIEDRYEVVLSATYETDVPAAVVVCNPTSVTLPDMSRGDVFRGEIRLKNVGLIRADNIRPAFPTPDAFFRVELSGPCPTVLAAGQEAVVPYRVTCLSPTSGEGGAAGGVYSTTAQFSYESTCAKEQVQRSTAQFYVLGSTDSHGTPVVWDPGPLVVTSPGGIGSSSSSSPRPPATSVGANRCTEDLNVGLEIEEPDLAVGCGVTVKVTVDGCIDEGCPASHSVQLFCDPSATITPRVVSVPVGGTAEAVLRGVCGSKQVRTDQVTALLGDKTVQVPFTVVEITGVEAEKEVGVGCSTQARAVVLPEGWPVKWSLADQYGRNGDVLATIDESTGVVRIDKQSAYGWVSARAEAAGVACPELSGKQAKIEIDCVECPSCDKVGGNGHAALSSFHVNIYLGTDSEGETAGRLYVFEESLGTNAWTPSGLRVAVDSDAVRVLHDTNGWVRQVLAPDGAADVVCTNASGYVVRWYGLDQSAGVATNGVHLFDGEPVSEWAISRVGSGDGGTTRVDVVKTEDGLSVTNAFETRDAGGTWILTQGNGLTRTRRVSEWASADTRVIRTEVSGVDSGVVSRTVEWEAVYPWGRETVRREVDAGGEILVSTWAYGTDSSVTGQYGRVLADTAPGGGWTRYEYDATGRLSRVVECWKDQPSGTPAERAKVTTYGYAPVDPRDDGSLWPSTARSTRTEVCGVLTESSYAAYFLDAGGRRVEVSEACVQAGNAYGTPGNPRTVTTYQPEDGTAAAGRVVRVEQSDGALETCAYAYGTWTASVAPGEGRFEEGAGTAWRRERVRGTLADPAGLPLRTTRDVTIRDATGRTVMESTEVFTGEDYQRVGWTARAFDNRGREVQVVRSNGETTEQAWGCCGKERDVDAAGGVQVYALDALSRQIGVRRMGVVDAEFGSQPDLTTEYGLDAAGRQVSLTRRSEDGTAYRSTTAYDLAGYATNRTTEAGVRMAMSRLSGGRIERTVLPGGLERVGEAYRSGAAKCTTEDGRLATWSDYGVAADGTTWATTWAGPQGTNAAAWERTVSDALGRTARVEAPGFGGGIILTNVFIHDESGRRVRAAAPGVADTLYAYDELGEQVRTALDINGNGRVDLAGPDRVWESRSRYERGERLAAGGGGAGWWQVQTEMCYPFENSATPVTNSVHRQRLTGFDAGCTSEEEFVDAWGNVTVRRREVDRTRRLVRTTVDTPESSTNGVQVELNGRPVYSAAPTGVELWHACDGFGRRVASTNPATGGTRTGYGSDDRVLWTEDGEGARTTYGFDPDTGRVVASTNALTNATYVAYDLWGRPVAQWGSAYPVRWTYDSFGRRASMGTLRDCSVLITNASDFAQHSNALDVTRWVYDEATGLLREKWLPDAGGTTGRNARVRYAYTAAGRLAARSWARGLMTRYAYDPASGLLTNIEYEGGDTPGVSVRRDRMGRPVWVQDGQGERTMSYGGRGELEAEAVAGPDGYRIGYGYAAAGVAGRLEAVTTDAGWSVTYGYDGGGRLSAISGEATTENGHRARTATYRYQAGTDRIAGWESDDGWSVSRTYEPRRPWLASAESAADGVAAVCHEYRADSVGRRTERKDSGALLVAAVTNSFGYNPRNELVSAADGAHAYTYAFDPVGNRLSATVDEIETRYAANALNAYTQIVTGAEMTGLATDADGNLLSDGTWRYKWDTENRLVACDPVVETNGARRLRFAYDHAGRRVSSEVDELAAGYWVARRSTRFMWDGWHMLGERTSGEEAGGEGTWQFHVWGPDVSGVPGGVGGVGGLVFTLASDGSVFEYGYDGNGNVSAVRESVSGTLTALDYTPFGAPLSPKPGTLPRFGFSTKYTDPETGLCYYGYRYYSPAQGRWLSRDPIGEAGGVNLYGFVGNDPVNGVDSLGLAGYFFGGTGNSLEPGRESNVEIIFRAWDLAANGSRWYVPGVFSGLQPGGEKNGVIDTMGTPLEGAWGKTLGDRAGEMMRHLEDELQAGDREVNVFGFSRGSATALEFLNRIQDKVSQGDPRYKCVRVKCVMLWDTVTHTSADYRSELPKGMTFDYQPLHFIALDERRSEFFDKEVLDVQGSLQIGYRGVHADVGGGYADSAFDWISRNDALYAAGVAGLRFDQGTLKKYPSKVNWAARPTTNDKWFYNGNEARSFPNAMYLHWSVGLFGAYSKPLNNVEGREDISREVWKQWSHQDWAF